MDYDEFDSAVSDLRDTYAGLSVTQMPGPQEPLDGLPDAAAVAWRLFASEFDMDGEDAAFADTFARFLEHVDTTRVTTIIVGGWEGSYENDSSEVIGLFVRNAARFPALRTLFLGAHPQEEAEISWIQQSDITPLLEAFPLLERLEIRGGEGLGMDPVRHTALKVLRFESGGLPGGLVRAVGESDLPALEYLEMWFGIPDYGGSTTVADLENILPGSRLPALRHLGLQNSEFQDEIAAAVAVAPVVARLESLSLSMGSLTDLGAEALLTGQPLTHLRRLDLHHHYLSDTMIKRVGEALTGVDVNLSDQGDRSRDWRFVAVSE